MRKLFFAAVLAVASMFSLQASAQLKFGLKGGVNVASMSFSSDVFDASNHTGFFVGPTVLLKIPVVGLSFDAAALYDQRESRVQIDSHQSPMLRTKAINVPINVRYGIGLGSLASVFAFAGPQLGFAIGDKERSIFNDAAQWTMSNSSFSVNVGAGLMLLNHLQLSANYNIACGKTGEVSVGNVAGDVIDGLANSKTRANAWQVGLAYYF